MSQQVKLNKTILEKKKMLCANIFCDRTQSKPKNWDESAYTFSL